MESLRKHKATERNQGLADLGTELPKHASLPDGKPRSRLPWKSIAEARELARHEACLRHLEASHARDKRHPYCLERDPGRDL